MSNVCQSQRITMPLAWIARLRAAFAVVLAAFVMTGCGAIMMRGANTETAPEAARLPQAEAPQVPDAAPIATPVPKVAAARPVEPRPSTAPRRITRGGRYFQDDGPGDLAPELLLAIPEPTPKNEPLAHYANNPYRAFGKPYAPEKARRPWKERGYASWYGRKFHGRRTATGERYDMYSLSAAHPTMPLPSYVRVKNLETGRTVVVRVNDRGPFLRNRVIDLSYAAAAKLGFAHKGSTAVEIEALLPGAPSDARPLALAPPEAR